MTHRRSLIIAAIFQVVLLGCRRSESAGQNLLKNPGFEDARKGLPKSWDVNSWQASKEKTVVNADGVIYRSGHRSLQIVHFLPNDTAVSQAVNVDPETIYRISGWIKTDKLKNIQGGIGAALSIGGTWTRSSDLKGDNPWTYQELWIKTSKNQDQLIVSCRLGYWYNVAAGTAWFDDIRLERLDKAPEGVVVNQVDGPSKFRLDRVQIFKKLFSDWVLLPIVFFIWPIYFL